MNTYSFNTEATRWDVWHNTFEDSARGFQVLSSSRLAGVIREEMGSFTVDCMACGTPLGDPKAGPDRGYGHPAKAYKSRSGARSALIRHVSRAHALHLRREEVSPMNPRG